MSRPTETELAAERDSASARRFFMGWLIASTTVSIGGNAAHAVLDYLPVIAVKIAVATLPPIVALVGIHGVAVLARCGHTTRADTPAKSGGWVYPFSVAVTGLLAAGAAVLSFTGLYGVATAGALSPRMAVLWPLCIDAGIAISTIALVVLRPATAADMRAARAEASAALAQSTAPAPARSPRTLGTSTTRIAAAPAPRHRAGHAPALQAVSSSDVDPNTSALARAVADSGATTKSADQVERVLAAHAAGTAITRIATETGLHHKTVRTIINAAAAHQKLAAVG